MITRKFVCTKAYPGFPQNVVVTNEKSDNSEIFLVETKNGNQPTDKGMLIGAISLKTLLESKNHWLELSVISKVITIDGIELKLKIEGELPDIKIRPSIGGKAVGSNVVDPVMYSKLLLGSIVNAEMVMHEGLGTDYTPVMFNCATTQPFVMKLMMECRNFLNEYLIWKAGCIRMNKAARVRQIKE
jgi:hypothetical protein